MNNPQTPIVVVAFNRPNSLSRLLTSLSNAYYPNNDIPLIISIDFSSNNKSVIDIAENFNWNNGEKIVISHQKNLGLRNHILACGDLSIKYGSVLILEDDLFVSPNFYNYTQAALKFSEDKTYLSGISLYNHKINVHTGEYFSALEDGFDNWYFQFASSWGQAWNKKQWTEFKNWYNNNLDLVPSKNIPTNVTNWSDKSWLKFFIAYLVETDKYFFYPKVSLSTNFNDPGTHVASDSTAYQVELFHGKKTQFNFSHISESKSRYDSFFENNKLVEIENLKNKNIEIDLYGYKTSLDKDYLLSSKRLNFKIISSYSRSLKPVEANIIYNIPGNELFLYDLKVKETNDFINIDSVKLRRIIYSSKIISHNTATFLFYKLSKSRFMELSKRILKLG
ncbi:hypothetical protein GCM10011414_10090 [Croceivirga lutea]|uniref:glycosyltransferase family 2 protein n=1 Tax=Croceivirga lutea TaxID=1775167 RepID=UPI00163A8676|nr:glycosyltransferase family 2 protein [Croceivirga lutea]GGG42496.1 hypothetical protein GCM10011414_10090 [Croceivirga lutea]